MKRLNLFLLGLAAIGMVFTSCTDDTNEEPPMLQIIDATGFVVDGAEVGASEAFKVKLNGSANATSGAELVSLEVLAIFNNATVADTVIEIDKQASFAADLTFDAPATAGTGKITFTLTDKKNQFVEESINLTFVAGLASQGTHQLGAGASTLGSYYSVSENTVYNVADAKANADKVDIVFTSDASTAKVFSPKNAAAQELIDANRTTTYQVVTLDFATVTTTQVSAVNPTSEEVNVTLGDVVVFENNDGVKGVFEVTQLTVASDGSVTLDIKVKQ